MQINKKQLAYNISKRTSAIKYIVVHDTGNPDNGADAERHFSYFNGGNRSSSADVFVDDRQILQVNDYTKYYTWHCGDGHGKYGISNSNSIGIEICINSDGDYDKAFSNTVEAVKYYMRALNIPADHVVRHYDASRKNCPQSFNANGWARWTEFKRRLTETEGLTVTQYEELKNRFDALDKVINTMGKEINVLQTENKGLKSENKSLKDRVYTLENPMIYNYIDENMPEWARDDVQWYTDRGIVEGTGEGLNLDDHKIWALIVARRIVRKIENALKMKL